MGDMRRFDRHNLDALVNLDNAHVVQHVPWERIHLELNDPFLGDPERPARVVALYIDELWHAHYLDVGAPVEIQATHHVHRALL
jgi:hypothetical protein